MAPEHSEQPEQPEHNLFHHHLLAVGKFNYAKGERPNVDCIFCGVRDNNPDITSLKVYEDERVFICLNLYPYNPGHLMVIPNRHLERFEDLSGEDRNYMFQVVMDCQKMLQDLFSPTGFNVGYNQGQYAGASIRHIHVHIVPRYREELGFIDIIGATKIIVENADSVFNKVKARIGEYVGSKRSERL